MGQCRHTTMRRRRPSRVSPVRDARLRGACFDRGGQRHPNGLPKGECMMGEESRRRTLLANCFGFG